MDGNLKPVAGPARHPDEPDESALVLNYVKKMQRDGRLLLRHIAGRADRVLPAAAALPPRQEPGSSALLRTLFEDPAALAADRERLDTLARCVDALSREAAPATAASIRLTRAYLARHNENPAKPDDDVLPEELRRRAKWLRVVLKGLALLTVALVLATLALLAHVDDGRRALVQLQAVRSELRAGYDELVRLPDPAWVTQKPPAVPQAVPFAHVCGDGQDGGRVPAATPDGARANGLCNNVYEGGLRLNLVLLRIEGWNCRTEAPWRWLLGQCRPSWPTGQPVASQVKSQVDPTEGRPVAAPTVMPAPERPNVKDWSRTEMRIEATIATLSGFILPLLTGFIGGAAYVLRRLDQKLSSHTLEPRDGWHAVLRVLLAMTLGGLVGVVWSGDMVSLGGINLSLAAAAFFIGFALEAVFTLIEAVVDSIAGRLRAEAGPPPRPTG